MNGTDRPDYHDRTVYENAERAAQSIIERTVRHDDMRAPNPEWDARGEVYARSTCRTEIFMIAGGGPSEYVCFVFNDDGDLQHAYLWYASAGASAAIAFPQFDAEDMYQQMKGYR